MNVIVLGAGDFGVEVAETFVQKGHNVTVLDKDPLRIDYITDNIDVFSIKGYGLNAEELEKAEINKADVFIATTASDESNILSSYLAKKKNPALKTAARIRYFNINGYPNLNYNDFGVDFIFNPERLALNDLLNIIDSNGAFEVIKVFGGKKIVRGYVITEQSNLVNKKVQKIIDEYPVFNETLFLCILRDDMILFPYGDTEIKAGDKLYIIGSEQNFREINPLSVKKTSAVKNIFIVGISKFTGVLVDSLIKHNYNVKIFAGQSPQLNLLAEKYEQARIINWEPGDVNTMLDEGLLACDCFISNDNNSDINVLSGLIAKRYNIKQNIIYSDNKKYFPFILSAGIDAIISPKLTAMGNILKHLLKSNILDSTSMIFGKAEMVMISVSRKSPLIKKAVKDINLPTGCIIAQIFRDDIAITPKGETTFKENDKVYFLTFLKNIGSIEKLS